MLQHDEPWKPDANWNKGIKVGKTHDIGMTRVLQGLALYMWKSEAMDLLEYTETLISLCLFPKMGIMIPTSKSTDEH